jgi:serine/threonine-protein kinase
MSSAATVPELPGARGERSAAIRSDDWPDRPTNRPPDRPQLPPRFELLGPCGSGGQKQTWHARDRARDRDVVIAHWTPAHGPAVDEAIERELRIAQALGRPRHGVVAEELLEADGHRFLVFRHLPGGDLARLLDSLPDRRLPISRVVALAYDVAVGLAQAHESGIVHGDVAPGNILFDAEGRAALADFGLARFVDEEPVTELHGTPTYLAPEAIRGEAPGLASDLYALGCVLYEALTGRSPFEGFVSIPDLLQRHQTATPSDLRPLRPETPRLLARLVESLMAKDSESRPARCRDVVGAIWAMKSAWNQYARSQPARDEPPQPVGRREERARLEAGLEAALRGHPHWILLAGEDGLGKTRLARHAIEEADRRGFLVLSTTVSASRRLPHGPIVDLLVQTGFAHLRDLEEEDARLLRQLLYLTDDTSEAPSAGHPIASRTRLHQLVASQLAVLCRQDPIALVVDDLHHVDTASLDLLAALERTFRSQPLRSRSVGSPTPDPAGRLLVFGTYRPTRAPRALLELAEAVSTRTHGDHSILSGLREDEIRQYLIARGVELPSRRLIEEIRTASGGNPFLLREIVRQLRESDGAWPSASSVSSLGDLPTPRKVVDWVAHRLEPLSPDCLQALVTFAIGGSELGLRSFQKILDAQGCEPQRAIREALRSGLIGLHHGQIQFDHSIVREAVVRRLDPEQRRELHLQIATAWTDAAHRQSHVREIAIAHHLFAAGSHADADEVVRLAERTARQACDRFAWAEAIQLLEYGLERAQAPAVRARLHHQIARAHFQRLDEAPCLHHYDQARRIYQAMADHAALARILAAMLRATVWLRPEDPDRAATGPRPVREALESLGPDEHGLRAALLCALAEYEHYCGDPRQAERLALSGCALPVADAEPALASDLEFTLATVRHDTLRLREGLEAWTRGAAHACEAGDLVGETRCLQRVQVSRFCLGELDAIEREGVAAGWTRQRIHAPGDQALARSIELKLALLRGDWKAVEDQAAILGRLLHRCRNPWSLLDCAYSLACARATQGDGVGAHRALAWARDFDLSFAASTRSERLDRSFRWLSDLYVGEAVGSTADPTGLRERVERSDDSTGGLVDACLAIELADHRRDGQLAAAALVRLEQAAARGWVFTTGWPFFIPRLLGVAAVLIGDLERARRAFQRALAWTEALRLPVEGGRSQLDLALLLVLRNAEGDRVEALRLARRARKELALCPRSVFASRAEKLVRYLESP